MGNTLTHIELVMCLARKRKRESKITKRKKKDFFTMLADQSSVVGSHLLSLRLVYSKAKYFTKYLYLSLPLFYLFMRISPLIPFFS